MTPEAARMVIRRYVDEVLNQGRADVLDEILTDDFIAHAPAEPGHGEEVQTHERLVEELERNRSAFPDMRFSLEDLVVEGNRAALRWVVTGTHKGDLMGAPPTGKKVKVQGMNFLHMREGKIAEDWVIWDSMGMMQQLGMMPPPDDAR